MLVITTTVRVLDWVHRNTSDSRPRVPLRLEFVVRGTSLEERLVDTPTTSDDPNLGTGCRRDDLLVTRRQPNPCLSSVLL